MQNNLNIKNLYIQLDNNYIFDIQFDINKKDTVIEYEQAIANKEYVQRIAIQGNSHVFLLEPDAFSLDRLEYYVNNDRDIYLKIYKENEVKHIIFSNNVIDKYKDKITVEFEINNQSQKIAIKDFINLISITFESRKQSNGMRRYTLCETKRDRTQWMLHNNESFELWRL